MKNSLLFKNTNFYNEIYTSGELSLVSWLWQVSGEAGSGELARPSWLHQFLKKIKCKKKVRPSAAKCVEKTEIDFEPSAGKSQISKKHKVFDIFSKIMYGFNKKVALAQFHDTLQRFAS